MKTNRARQEWNRHFRTARMLARREYFTEYSALINGRVIVWFEGHGLEYTEDLMTERSGVQARCAFHNVLNRIPEALGHNKTTVTRLRYLNATSANLGFVLWC